MDRIASMRCVALILATLIAAVPAQAENYVYTSLEDCKVTEQVEEGAYAELSCPAPDGWGVRIIDFDSRSHLILSHLGKDYSLQRDMIEEFSFGQFPGVGRKAEWVVGPQGPEALIVRMHYMKDDTPRSILFVFGLYPEPRLLGTTPSNEQARRIASAR